MPTIETEVTFNVECECGTTLKCNVPRCGDVVCEACPSCCANAKDEGYQEGLEDANAADN